MDVRAGQKEDWMSKNWCFQTVVLESLGWQGDQTSHSKRKSTLNFHWKDWCWSWSSNTLATWCKEPTHWKRLWCWERLRAGGEGDGRGWDGWMASLTRWTWVWANSRRWWRTGKPGVLHSMYLKESTGLSDWTATSIIGIIWLGYLHLTTENCKDKS